MCKLWMGGELLLYAVLARSCKVCHGTTYMHRSEGKPSEATGTAATGKKNSDAKVKPSEEAGGPPTKRRPRMCGCLCHEGIIRLEGFGGVPDDPEQDYRCTCRSCGPMLPDGTQQCEHELTPDGAATSLWMDGQLICFDCRGFE